MYLTTKVLFLISTRDTRGGRERLVEYKREEELGLRFRFKSFITKDGLHYNPSTLKKKSVLDQWVVILSIIVHGGSSIFCIL